MASILVIEDDADIRALYCRILSQAGHAVTEAPDGSVGLRLYRQKHRDLVITDIIMPEKEGIETIMELQRESPDVQIIAISGGGQATPGATCLHLAKRLGAARTLAKPFSKQELLDAVTEVLERSMEIGG
ncbi:MAG: response regulator [Desulfomonile tiedjei]|nr:response regulator [Desulfomonile tiedjei]